MNVKYELEGMNCEGCVRNVRQALLQVPDITDVEVLLKPQRVNITMTKSISVDELKLQLNKAENYSIKQLSIY